MVPVIALVQLFGREDQRDWYGQHLLVLDHRLRVHPVRQPGDGAEHKALQCIILVTFFPVSDESCFTGPDRLYLWMEQRPHRGVLVIEQSSHILLRDGLCSRLKLQWHRISEVGRMGMFDGMYVCNGMCQCKLGGETGTRSQEHSIALPPGQREGRPLV